MSDQKLDDNVDNLLNRLSTTENSTEQQEIAEQLVKIGNDIVIDGLLELLRKFYSSYFNPIHNIIVDSLIKIGTESVANQVANKLLDEKWPDSHCLIEILTNIYEVAINPIIRAISVLQKEQKSLEEQARYDYGWTDEDDEDHPEEDEQYLGEYEDQIMGKYEIERKLTTALVNIGISYPDKLINAMESKDNGCIEVAAAALDDIVESITTVPSFMDKEKYAEFYSRYYPSLSKSDILKKYNMELKTHRLKHETVEKEHKDKWVNALIAHLNSNNKHIQIVAIEKLGLLKDKNTTKPLILLFSNQSVNDEDRKCIIDTLVQINDIQAENVLIKALSSGHDSLHELCIGALGSIKSKKAAPLIISILENTESDYVMSTCINALGNIQDSAATWPIIKCMESKARELKKECVVALGKIKNAEALKTLQKIIENEEEEYGVRSAAVEALKNMEAVQTLLDSAKLIADVEIRGLVLKNLGELEQAVVMDALIEALNDSNWYIRKMAILGLKELGDVKAIDKVKKMLDDESRDVNDAAEKTIQSLARKKRVRE